ncbi:phage tail assembly protein [Beijerinckia sp. L45]|uniref:phage tail assembly protein n=1 Tax=Beijerinckia sp. L45 TaxID=1641855 RepID=UPI00131AA224|nr:phage tail assembly protein [Beijerinckia sp. L45]
MSFTPVPDPIFTHVLKKPIRFLDDEISEIAVREPTSGDMQRHGNPVKYDPRFDPPTIEIDETKAFAMLSALSGIPVSILGQLKPNDALEIFWGFARHFIPGL